MNNILDLQGGSKRPLYVMLIGLPGSGKSFLARHFLSHWTRVSNIPIAHLSSDAFIEAEARRRQLTYNDVFAATIETATNRFRLNCAKLLEQRATVVIDRTNLTLGSRAKLLLEVPTPYRKIAVIVSVDEELRQARLEERSDKIIPPDTDNHMRNSYQPPTQAEGFDLVITSKDLYKVLLATSPAQ